MYYNKVDKGGTLRLGTAETLFGRGSRRLQTTAVEQMMF